MLLRSLRKSRHQRLRRGQAAPVPQKWATFESGRWRTAALCGLLLLLFVPGYAQDFVIGGQFTKAQIEDLRKASAAGKAADKTLGEMTERKVELEVGKFFPFRFGNPNQLWIWSDDSICKRLDVPAGHKFAFWGMLGDEKTPSLHEDAPSQESRGYLVGIKAGQSQITVIANGDGGGPPVVLDRIIVAVKGNPDPGPGPTPEPPPGPTPIPGQGLRVLIVYESKDLSTYPAAQVAAMNAREVREYLSAKCVKVNGQPEWRMYDQNTDVTRESDIWQKAMQRPRQSLPWLMISDGTKGYEGPLPGSKDELLMKLKAFGGQ